MGKESVRVCRWGYCDECHRKVNLSSDGLGSGKPVAADYGSSHHFCDDCLMRLELEQAA